jgi:hypothetical protein
MTATGLRVRLHASSLERRLAAGEDPRTDRALELRAAQLVAARERRALAAAIERIVDEVDKPSAAISAAAPVCRAAIKRARPQLLELVSDLRSPWPVRAAGVVLVRRLLRDGASPLYGLADEKALLAAVGEARQRLPYPQGREN